MSELKSWQGLPADALSPEPLPILPRPGSTFVGHLCCAKADWTVFRDVFITACPDHGVAAIGPDGPQSVWEVR